MDYDSLKKELEGISKEVAQKRGNLTPKFYEPIKSQNCFYLVVNMNPSDSEFRGDSRDIFNEFPYLCTFGRLINADKSHEKRYSKLKKRFAWNFFDKPYKILKEIDPKVSLYWEDMCILNALEDKIKLHLPEALHQFNQLKKDFEELNKKESGNKLCFAELLCLKYKNQNKITNIFGKNLEKENELQNKIKEALVHQIAYYNPKIILITNTWVSKFVEKNLLSEKGELGKKEVYHKDGRIFILAPMLNKQRAIDDYSLLRLKRDIIEARGKLEN